MADKISVGVPYTVPFGTGNWGDHTKGSARWLETLGEFMGDTGRFDVSLLGPAYEGLNRDQLDRPWHNLPILYAPPAPYADKFKMAPSPDDVDIHTPIHSFTLDGKYALTSSAGPREFRAITEVTRWYLDMMPALSGRDHYDVVFPQHFSWNMIVSAHYAAMGKAVVISHETCVRCDKKKGEGGWAAVNLRPYLYHAFNGGPTKVIAISGMVARRLIQDETGPRLSADRVVVKTNPYNEKKYYRVPDMTKVRFVDEYLKPEIQQNKQSDVPQDGKWLVFVGRGAEFKGIEQLLRSWAVAQKKEQQNGNSKDVLFVIGPGTNDDMFKSYARELGISDRVRFLAGREPEFINALYNAADLAVMTSLNEGDGVVAKQPGGTGLRVVAPDSGGPAEYMTDWMGRRVKSRDPNRRDSKTRGLLLLLGMREIRWGNVVLSGADVLMHYIKWQEFYGKDIKDKAVLEERKADISRLSAIADDWNNYSPVKDYAAQLLRAEITETAVPSFPSHDMALLKDMELLADAFEAIGGMDVETGSLAEAYHEEFSIPPWERHTASQLAYLGARKTFSSKAYVDWLSNEFFEDAAKRPFDPDSVAVSPINDTVISGMEVYQEAAKAFRAWQEAETTEHLLGAVTAFNRSVLTYLGNPNNYKDRWPTPDELAMRDPRRSSKVAARLAGVSLKEYTEARQKLIRNASADPNLQSALYLAQVGYSNPSLLPAAISAAAMVSSSAALIH